MFPNNSPQIQIHGKTILKRKFIFVIFYDLSEFQVHHTFKPKCTFSPGINYSCEGSCICPT